MALSPLFPIHPYAIAVTLFFLGADAAYAQLAPSRSTSGQIAQIGTGQTGQIIGQPPRGRSSSIIGGPPAGQSGSALGQPSIPGQPSVPGQPAPGQEGLNSPPNYPGTGSTVYPGSSMGRDVVKDKLDRAREEAADIDRDGRISPYEASRMPGATVPPGATTGTPLPR